MFPGLSLVIPDKLDANLWTASRAEGFLITQLGREARLARESADSNALAGPAAAIIQVIQEVLLSYTDTLRLGQGVDRAIRSLLNIGDGPLWSGKTWVTGRRSTGSFTQDFINQWSGFFHGLSDDFWRALNVIPVGTLAVRGLRYVRRGRLLVQAAGTNVCLPVATGNAVMLSEQRAFMAVEDLVQSGDELLSIERGGTTPERARQMLRRLRRMGVTAQARSAADLVDLEGSIIAHADGAFTFTLDLGGESVPGHTMAAVVERGAVKFFDPYGPVYNGLADMLRQYRGATLALNYPFTYFPRAALTHHNNTLRLLIPVGVAIIDQLADLPRALGGPPAGSGAHVPGRGGG